MIKKEKLEFWIRNKYNVLFVGKHGVGKTSIIKQAFDDAGLAWKYFSAATMDPWVDFIGTPKEHKDENGVSYLDLVRPREFQFDTIEALFFDEFNRAPKKVRNAVMELIQFRSVNGKRFNNLKVIWAAINPEDEDDGYDVEKLDPAQKDRFHVIVSLPYQLHKPYFVQKYGAKVATATNMWWSALAPPVKDEVSPRRVDYALDIHKKGGDIDDVLPSSCGISTLKTLLNNEPLDQQVKKASSAELDDLLKDETTYNLIRTQWTKDIAKKVLPHLSRERVAALIQAKPKDITLRHQLVEIATTNDNFFETIQGKAFADFWARVINSDKCRRQVLSSLERIELVFYIANYRRFGSYNAVKNHIIELTKTPDDAKKATELLYKMGKPELAKKLASTWGIK